MNENVFKANPLLLFGFGALGIVFLWPVVFGLGEPSPLSHGLDLFLLLNVLPRLLFFGMAAFFGLVIVILCRSHIRLTPDVVEYFDGWRKLRRIARSEILSAKVRSPGSLLVIRCTKKENNFAIPMIAYSRSGLLVTLLHYH